MTTPRQPAGMEFVVDILGTFSHEDLEQSAEDYMSELLHSNPDNPEYCSLPDSRQIPLSLANMGFVPIYGSDLTRKVLALFAPEDQSTAVALYLADQWWPVEEILHTSDSSREGLLKVDTLGERIVLYVLNRLVYRAKEIDKNEVPFLCHAETDYAKILWKDGEAIGFYSIKPKGSLCSSFVTQRYLLPVMDSIFVRKAHRGNGHGLRMLEDFVDSFKEDALGLKYPISRAMYKVCACYLCTYPADEDLLWEVESVGGPFQKSKVARKVQMSVEGDHPSAGAGLLGEDVTETEISRNEDVSPESMNVEVEALSEQIPVTEVTGDTAISAATRSSDLKRKRQREEAEDFKEIVPEKMNRVEEAGMETVTPSEELAEVEEEEKQGDEGRMEVVVLDAAAHKESREKPQPGEEGLLKEPEQVNGEQPGSVGEVESETSEGSREPVALQENGAQEEKEDGHQDGEELAEEEEEGHQDGEELAEEEEEGHQDGEELAKEEDEGLQDREEVAKEEDEGHQNSEELAEEEDEGHLNRLELAEEEDEGHQNREEVAKEEDEGHQNSEELAEEEDEGHQNSEELAEEEDEGHQNSEELAEEEDEGHQNSEELAEEEDEGHQNSEEVVRHEEPIDSGIEQPEGTAPPEIQVEGSPEITVEAPSSAEEAPSSAGKEIPSDTGNEATASKEESISPVVNEDLLTEQQVPAIIKDKASERAEEGKRAEAVEKDPGSTELAILDKPGEVDIPVEILSSDKVTEEKTSQGVEAGEESAPDNAPLELAEDDLSQDTVLLVGLKEVSYQLPMNENEEELVKETGQKEELEVGVSERGDQHVKSEEMEAAVQKEEESTGEMMEMGDEGAATTEKKTDDAERSSKDAMEPPVLDVRVLRRRIVTQAPPIRKSKRLNRPPGDDEGVPVEASEEPEEEHEEETLEEKVEMAEEKGVEEEEEEEEEEEKAVEEAAEKSSDDGEEPPVVDRRGLRRKARVVQSPSKAKPKRRGKT